MSESGSNACVGLAYTARFRSTKLGELTEKAGEFAAEANIKETGEGVGRALSQLVDEIKLGYDRIWKALKDD